MIVVRNILHNFSFIQISLNNKNLQQTIDWHESLVLNSTKSSDYEF